MELKYADVAAGRMQLSLHVSERIGSGLIAAFGGGFATVAMSFLRAPVPAPFKIVPLAFLFVGAGLGTFGALGAMAEFVIEVERGRGVTFRWRRGRRRREAHVADSEIETFAVTPHAVHRGAAFSNEVPLTNQDWVEFQYRLVLVTKSGEAYPVDNFNLPRQALIRQRLIEDVLGRR
jgi:hypothetical protein